MIIEREPQVEVPVVDEVLATPPSCSCRARKVSASSPSGASHFLRRLPLCLAEIARPSSRLLPSARPRAMRRLEELTSADRDYVRPASSQSSSQPCRHPWTCLEDRKELARLTTGRP